MQIVINITKEDYENVSQSNFTVLTREKKAHLINRVLSKVAEGTILPAGEDTISRKQAIEKAWTLVLETSYDNEKVVDMLEDLLPVTPTRKKGKWIEYPHEWGDNWQYSDYECSICHNRAHFDADYCPNCGAEMEV